MSVLSRRAETGATEDGGERRTKRLWPSFAGRHGRLLRRPGGRRYSAASRLTRTPARRTADRPPQAAARRRSRISVSVSADGACVTGTTSGRSNSKPVFSITSSTVCPGCTLSSREALCGLVEREQAAVGHQRDRPAGAMHVRLAAARRRDEADLRHQRAARVLDAEQDHLRHDVIEIAGAERAGEAHLRIVVVADARRD